MKQLTRQQVIDALIANDIKEMDTVEGMKFIKHRLEFGFVGYSDFHDSYLANQYWDDYKETVEIIKQ